MTDPSKIDEALTGMPWWARFMSNPVLLANVVAFGAAMLLLYTAAVQWPRESQRFFEQMQAIRDGERETMAVVKENQSLLVRMERQEERLEAMLREFAKLVVELIAVLKKMPEPP